jgi:hypothetical protein
MFIYVFSGHEYEEHFWPAVFELESMMLGILIEDLMEMRNLSIAETKSHIKNYFASSEFPQTLPLPHPPDEWIEGFLDREIPFVRNLIDTEEGSSLSNQHPKLTLDEQRLTTSIQRSKTFATFIFGKKRGSNLPG